MTGANDRAHSPRKRSSPASLPKQSIWSHETPKYFTADDAQTIAKRVKLDLSHGDGGLHAAKLLQRVAVRFAQQQLLGKDPDPEQFVKWATAVHEHSGALARLLHSPTGEGRVVDTSLETLRVNIEADQKEQSNLARHGRILSRSSQHLGGYEGDPFPIAIMSIGYLHEFAAAVREQYASPNRKLRKKGSTVGADELVQGLADCFVSIFGRPARVSSNKKTERRDGPAVRFMKEFARILETEIKADQPEAGRRLKSWANSNSDALANRLIKTRKVEERRSVVK